MTTIPAVSQAATLLSVNFDAPTYSDAVLVSSTDTTTAGTDGWINTSGAGTNNIATSNTATNGIVSLATNGQDIRKNFDGAASVTSGSVYYAADITLSSATATGDYFMHLGTGTSSFYGRLYAKSDGGTGFYFGTAPVNAAATYGTTSLAFGTTYHVVVQYDLVAGTLNDVSTVYVNPTSVSDTDGITGTVYATSSTASTGADATSITGFYLRQGGASSSAVVSSIDNVTVGTIVPEPSSLAVVGLGGLMALRRRRA